MCPISRCEVPRETLSFETVLSSEGKVDFIRLFFVSTSHPSINSSRIVKRVMKGGHDVPIPKIISRYQKSIVNCKRCAALADRVYVYDNSVDDTEARLLFRRRFLLKAGSPRSSSSIKWHSKNKILPSPPSPRLSIRELSLTASLTVSLTGEGRWSIKFF
jgi:hypothetical protein